MGGSHRQKARRSRGQKGGGGSNRPARSTDRTDRTDCDTRTNRDSRCAGIAQSRPAGSSPASGSESRRHPHSLNSLTDQSNGIRIGIGQPSGTFGQTIPSSQHCSQLVPPGIGQGELPMPQWHEPSQFLGLPKVPPWIGRGLLPQPHQKPF